LTASFKDKFNDKLLTPNFDGLVLTADLKTSFDGTLWRQTLNTI